MSAYSKGYVVSIINSAGQPVREFNESNIRTCILPFDSEYKIRIKNLDSVYRAKARVFIDGMDISSSNGTFVLKPGESVDLERFVDSLNGGSKFKFISKEKGISTGEVSDPENPDLGKIKVMFYQERRSWLGSYMVTNQGDSWRKSGVSYDTFAFNSNSSNTAFFGNAVERCLNSADAKYLTDGATAQGSHSDQKFVTASDFLTDDVATIVEIKLRGPEKKNYNRDVELGLPLSKLTFEGGQFFWDGKPVDNNQLQGSAYIKPNKDRMSLDFEDGQWFFNGKLLTEKDFSGTDGYLYFNGFKLPGAVVKESIVDANGNRHLTVKIVC